MKKHLFRAHRMLLVSFSLLALLVGLSGCIGGFTPSVGIFFFQDNQWYVSFRAIAPVDSDEANAAIEGSLQQFIARANQNNVKVTDKRERQNNDIQYTLELSGTGLTVLSDILFDGQAEIQRIDSNGRQRISFILPKWAGKDGVNHIALTIAGGSILQGNGSLSSGLTDEWDGMDWSLYQGGDMRVSLLPWSCMGLSSGDLRIDFLPDGFWAANLGLTAPGGSCPMETLKTEVEQGLMNFAAQSGAVATWEKPTASDGLRLTVYGQGGDALSKILLDGQGQVTYATVDNRKITFSLPDQPSPGYRLEALHIDGQIVSGGNGSFASTREMTWSDFRQGVTANLVSNAYLHMARANLVVDFLTGQRWQAAFDVQAPLYFAEWDEKIRSEMGALLEEMEQYPLEGAVTCQKVSSADQCRLEANGTDFAALGEGVFAEAASFTTDQTGWSRTIQYQQYRETPWGFGSLVVSLRGGEILDGNGERASDAANGEALQAGGGTSGSAGQAMQWTNPGRGAQASLTERFVWDYPAVSDTLLRWGKKTVAVWLPLCLIALFGLVIVARGAMQKRETRRPSAPQAEKAVEHPTPSPEPAAARTVQTLLPAARVEGPRGVLVLPDGRRVGLPQDGPFLVGSSAECGLALQGDGAAPLHAILRPARTRYFIENLSAGQPILVNGVAVEKSARLENLDQIQVGSTRIEFLIE